MRRRNAGEDGELAEHLERLADSRDPAARRRLTVQRISHLTADFRKLVVGHLRVAQRLEEMESPSSLVAHYRARADEYDATAEALAGTIAE